MHGEVHFILNGGKEALCGFCGRVEIQRGRVDIRNFLVEFPLAHAYFADFFQLFVKVPIRQRTAVFQALGIHCPALHGILVHNLVCPNAEAHGTLVIDLEANGDDHLQAVMVNRAGNLSVPFGLNR